MKSFFFKNPFEKTRPVPDPVPRDTGSFHHWVGGSGGNFIESFRPRKYEKSGLDENPFNDWMESFAFLMTVQNADFKAVGMVEDSARRREPLYARLRRHFDILSLQFTPPPSHSTSIAAFSVVRILQHFRVCEDDLWS